MVYSLRYVLAIPVTQDLLRLPAQPLCRLVVCSLHPQRRIALRCLLLAYAYMGCLAPLLSALLHLVALFFPAYPLFPACLAVPYHALRCPALHCSTFYYTGLQWHSQPV